MRIIKQYCEWLQPPPSNTLELIERAGRISYKSEDKTTQGSAASFVGRILTQQHESVIEHVSASMLFVTDRGVSHEIVRHRIASYTQESTRYCNYSRDKFGNGVTFILPVRFYDTTDEKEERYDRWMRAMRATEMFYLAELSCGATAQEARDFLPNSLKTEIAMTANLREWLYILRLRTAHAAHPQMRDLMSQAVSMFKERVPLIFNRI